MLMPSTQPLRDLENHQEFIARHIMQTYKVPVDRLRLVPNGIDLERFSPERVHAHRMLQLQKDWRLPDGVPVILLPGRLTRWKGQTVLIEALTLPITSARSAPDIRGHGLADVVVYCLRLADVLGIDLPKAIRAKLKKNAAKYPVRLAKGNAKKYTDLKRRSSK